MKVDIWSDIRCPFCYIGKRKFETALAQFPNKESIEVEWHSFELDPSLTTRTDISVIDYLASVKKISRQKAVEMNDYVRGVAAEVGLDFINAGSTLANSFNAHRLIQMAKTKGLGDNAKEALLEAHFTDGKNIDDRQTLIDIATSIGLPEDETAQMLDSSAYTPEVRNDEKTASEIGINGVPFFVFNNKYAVSGAQAPATFLDVLQNAWKDFEAEKPVAVLEGETCSADGC